MQTNTAGFGFVIKSFGLRLRRIKASLCGKPGTTLDEEIRQNRAAFLHYLDDEAERLTVRSVAARARRAQMEFDR